MRAPEAIGKALARRGTTAEQVLHRSTPVDPAILVEQMQRYLDNKRQIEAIWLAEKVIPVRPACTGCSGDPRKRTFLWWQRGKRCVMSGSSRKPLRFRGILFPSRELAECWYGAVAEVTDIAVWQWERRKTSHSTRWV